MPNEQTSVPLFTSGEVLTAANMNLSAGTGVPVFATTVTRDAAFGGAGEKVLAEGQLCYLSSTNVVQYYDGAAWATVGPTVSKIAQVVSTILDTTFTTSSTSMTDVTGLSVTITPTLNTSKVLVMVQLNGGGDASSNFFGNLVRGSTAIDVGATAGTRSAVTFFAESDFMYYMGATFLDSPATTSATTYKVQVKTQGAGNVFVNRRPTDNDAVSRPRVASTITVMEVLA
jgi:hypothetical protein